MVAVDKKVQKGCFFKIWDREILMRFYLFNSSAKKKKKKINWKLISTLVLQVGGAFYNQQHSEYFSVSVKGKKAVKGKDKPKDDKLSPSDDELRNAICEILKEVDFNTVRS